MTLYLAADKPLPLVARDESNPSFHVSALNEEADFVRHQFSKRHLYYLGSWQGCGCGFSYGEYEDRDEEEEKSGRESVRRLAGYLADAVRLAGAVELYSCWAGDAHSPPEFRKVVSLDEIPDRFGGESFFFEERAFIAVTQ